MNTVLLIIHLFVTLALIAVVLIQRSEGGGLGIGSSQGMGAFMSGRGTANLLTRTTAILAAIFFALSMTLALINRGQSGPGHSILDTVAPQSAPVPGSGAPGGPPAPTVPGNSGPAAAGPVSPSPATASPATASPATASPATSKPATPSGPTVPTN